MVQTLDITTEQCPMTFVKTKVALHGLSKGDVLEVFLRGEESLRNVPPAVQAGGDDVLSVEQVEGDVYRMLVEVSTSQPS